MAKRYGFLFPGQGAQYPGMGKDFYDAFATVRHTFEEADDLLGRSLSSLTFSGPADELMLTKNSQIAIYVLGVALFRLFREHFSAIKPSACAGLSLGEYTALTAAEKLFFPEGLELVRVRAEAMHQACQERAGSMHVVLGLSEQEVRSVLEQLNPPHPVWVANLNCPGQVVIAGTQEALLLAADPLKQKGAKRVLPLDVSGAFHSPLMQSAQEKLAGKIALVPLHESSIRIVMNALGDFVEGSEKIREELISQLTSPVYWERGVVNMVKSGLDAYIEMGPGKTLSGMFKRIGVTEPIYSLDQIGDLQSLEGIL